jgi:competence protein ComEA
MNIEIMGKQIFINKILLICICIVLLSALGTVGFFLSRSYSPLESAETEELPAIQSASAESTTAPKQEVIPEIKVYVTGCVNTPGLVTLKKGQIIDDAIKAAGGATKNADIENINLAYKLSDNVMLRIKARGEKKTDNKVTTVNAAKPANTGSKSSAKNKAQIDEQVASVISGVDVITDSLNTVVGEQSQDNKSGGLTNINKSSSTELEKLPSIGAATAKAIIEYREKNGEFKDIKDIMKISGIKQKTFDKIKDLITIE